MNRRQAALAILLSHFGNVVGAWCQPRVWNIHPSQGQHIDTPTSRPTTKIALSNNDDDTPQPLPIKDNKEPAQFGVSYIGGDPCGSEYNTDPHDAQVEKPGMAAKLFSLLKARKAQKERGS